MAASHSTSAIPQGFSVYQPMLGAPLQFFPALGTKELDDMLDAYIPGPASLKEKRATVSVDFFDYTQRTGQAFKFYTVPGLTANVAESPSTASPLQATASTSSLNASPVTSNWDWSSVTGPASSRASTHARSSRKGSTATASSRRHAPTDFSHLPGMKILTKEGMDVTNSASRGSKTKEQRDHAHLMRIIKACDSCKKKKIRCDPSHKKRSATAQAQGQPAAKPSKKIRTLPQDKPSVAPPPLTDESFALPQTPSLDWDSPLEFPEFESFDLSTAMHEPWEDFIHYPPAGIQPDYDFFSDPNGYLYPQDQQTSTSSSMSPFMSTSDDQLTSQSFSSSSSLDSPDLRGHGLFQASSSSSSASPELPDLDGYVMPPDLSLSATPEVPGRNRHVLPQYPMPPTGRAGSVDTLDGDILSQSVSTSMCPAPSGINGLAVASPWSASSNQQLFEGSMQSQPDSPVSMGSEQYVDCQSTSLAAPTSAAIHVGSQDLNDVEERSSSSDSQAEEYLRSHVRSPASIGLQSLQGPQELESAPNWRKTPSSDSRVADRYLQPQPISPASMANGNPQELQPLAGRTDHVMVPETLSSVPRAIGDGLQTSSLGAENHAQSQPGLSTSSRLVTTRESTTLSSSNTSNEMNAQTLSSVSAELSRSQCSGRSLPEDSQDTRVGDHMVRRPISASTSAPLSSNIQGTTSRPEHDALEGEDIGLDAGGVGVYDSLSLPSARRYVPRTAIDLRLEATITTSSTTSSQVPSLHSPTTVGVSLGEMPPTGTDCVSPGAGRISSLAVAGVSLCAVLELLSVQQHGKTRRSDSWMAGLFVLIPLVAIASSFSSFC